MLVLPRDLCRKQKSDTENHLGEIDHENKKYTQPKNI